MKPNACILQALVDAHFAGTISAADERRMRAHLDDCERCRRRYSRWLVLAKLDPEALAPEARLAAGLALGAEPAKAAPARRAWIVPLVAAIAAAAALALILRTPKEDGFAARGGVDAGADVAPGKAPLHVYRVAEAGRPTPVIDAVRRDDELAFAYENDERKKYLMIFASDDTGRVYWFYPAWTNPADDPQSIAASVEPGVHELPDAIVHRFAGSRLDVHALFLDAPTTVRAVEARLADGGAPIDGGVDRVVHLRVER